MRVTRRTFMHVSLASAASLSAERALAQGIASHTAQPLARPAPSGRPFLSRFVDVAAVSGLTAPVVYGALDGQKYILEAIGCGCAFVDYDNDGHLDLFVSNYVQFSFTHAPVSGANTNCNWKGIPVVCGPRGLPPGTHSLYRNNGDGTFTDVSRESGISGAPRTYGMTVVAADFDEDGWPDIY